MDGQTNAPRQSPEDRGKARQDSTTPSVHSVTTDDRQPSPRARRRHSGRVARSGAQSSGAQRNTLRRRSSSRSESFGPHPGSSRDITAAMQRSLGPFEPEPISYTPTTHRVSKAKKGKRVHACEYPGCDKVFTRAEHRRRHELNHSPEPYQCGVAGCQKSFHRLDLLTRHMERQHNESERGYRHGRSPSQVSGTALDPATVIATTVSPTAILDSNTQPSSAMSIYSIVDTTPSGFVTQPMGPFNDLAQIPVPSGPHGFAPDLVYGAASTSDESTIYSDDSCYSPNTDYSRAHIASQPYLPAHDRQHSPALTSLMDPYYQLKSPLYSTSTLPTWCDAETGQPPQELAGTQHLEGAFLQPVGTPLLGCPPNELLADAFLDCSIPIPLSDLDGYEWSALRRVFPTGAGATLDKHGMVVGDVRNISEYLNCYWQHFDPLWPIVHRSTFLASTPAPLLAAVMVAIGAQFSSRPLSKGYSTSMYEACMKLLSTGGQITSRSRISDLQTILLLEIFSKYRSRRADVQISSRFRIIYSSLLQDRNHLLADPLLPSRDMPKHMNQEVLQAAWSRWIDHETRRRILLSAFVFETQQVTLVQQRSRNRHNTTEELDLPFPCESLLWECSSAANWRLRSLSERSYCLRQAADVALSSEITMDSFQSTVVLCHLVSDDKSATRSDHRLQAFQHRLHKSTYDGVNPALFTYHALLMAKTTPLSALLTVSGESWIFGHKLSEEADFHAAKATLRAWATSPANSSQAVWHATALLRLVMRDDNGINALHEQWSIYVAALVCWAFGFVAQPCVDPLTALWNFEASSVEDQAMWIYLSAMDKPSWEFMADVPLRWRTAGLLECVRKRIEGPMGGLLNEAHSVLTRLVEGVSLLSDF